MHMHRGQKEHCLVTYGWNKAYCLRKSLDLHFSEPNRKRLSASATVCLSRYHYTSIHTKQNRTEQNCGASQIRVQIFYIHIFLKISNLYQIETFIYCINIYLLVYIEPKIQKGIVFNDMERLIHFKATFLITIQWFIIIIIIFITFPNLTTHCFVHLTLLFLRQFSLFPMYKNKTNKITTVVTYMFLYLFYLCK